MRSVYRKVAKQNGVSVAEVKQEIAKTITAAYTDPQNQNEITQAYQRRVPMKGETPTPDELIRYMAGEVRSRQK